MCDRGYGGGPGDVRQGTVEQDPVGRPEPGAEEGQSGHTYSTGREGIPAGAVHLQGPVQSGQLIQGDTR